MPESDAKAFSIDPEQHLSLVRMCVRRCPAYGIDPEELFQQGCIGLMQAAARYNPALGTSFSSYAVPYIFGEIKACLRSYTHLHMSRKERNVLTGIRRASDALRHSLRREPHIHELAEHLHMEPGELAWHMASGASAVYNDAAAIERHQTADWTESVMLRDLLDRLPPDDRRLLYLRYMEGMTQHEAAQRLGMTQVQLSRREAKLRQLLRAMWSENEKD